ncbi:hypothetical protein [Aestuariibaculum marinum]|uniref:Uncharacterized protein n=1 Tax=Aestuariibaculum marinum TaxID=2683592 RepID=A0A8J6U7D1_9FLAO|nr:hypothetical protein [Aestuariibaculum marinum]MBD0825194.1 hypothetical protein [Aestuariibaculum marinum]
MNRLIYNLGFWTFILTGISTSNAQSKNICISDSLFGNSEKHKVKVGIKSGNKMWNFRFGDYHITKSKTGWLTSTEKSNFLYTKTESKSKYKFSLTLANKTRDTAIVNSLNKTSIKELHSFELFKNFHVGYDEVAKQYEFFTSFITLNNYKDEIWELLIENTYDKNFDSKNISFLKHKQRVIHINPVSSKQCSKDKRWFPALGYEFEENGESLCAMQYFGGGLFGQNKYFVWLKTDLDPKLEFILSAAMTAIMEVRGPDYLEQMLFNDND